MTDELFAGAQQVISTNNSHPFSVFSWIFFSNFIYFLKLQNKL